MFLQDKDSRFLEQKTTKPKIESVITEYQFLHSGVKEMLQDFIIWLKSNKISLGWASSNAWKMAYKGSRLGTVRLYEGSLYIDPPFGNNDGDLEKFIINENLAEIIWNNVEFCVNCFCATPGHSARILGRDFENVCHSVRFKDPGTDEFACAKKLLEYVIKTSQSNSTAKRPVFDPETAGLTRIENKMRVSGVSDLRGIPNENAERLFDGDYSQSLYVGPYGPYKSDGRSCEITFHLDVPVTIEMYSIVTNKNGVIPNSWILYGAVSENDFRKQLDARINTDAFTEPIPQFSEKAFKVDNPGSYRYYKIVFEGGAFQLSQMHFYVR